MFNPGMILDVIRFELKRSMTKGRIGIWCILVAFPVILFYLMNSISGISRADAWTWSQYLFIVEIVCQLGLLLWATPVVSTEIESQTWIYLAMRQSGRSTVFIGKYFTAVIWTFSAAMVALTLCMVVVPDMFDVFHWYVMTILAALSCIAHAAIFLLIGVLFQKRAMVTAVFYTLAIEYGLSFVPALANKITVNYRLRSLLANWVDLDENIQRELVFIGAEPTHIHLFCLFTITLVALCAALFRLKYAEYPTQQDG